MPGDRKGGEEAHNSLRGVRGGYPEQRNGPREEGRVRSIDLNHKKRYKQSTVKGMELGYSQITDYVSRSPVHTSATLPGGKTERRPSHRVYSTHLGPRTFLTPDALSSTPGPETRWRFHDPVEPERETPSSMVASE